MNAAKLGKALFPVILLLMASAVAQKSASPKYDLNTETTLKGVVEQVTEVPNSCMGQTGLHLLLKTEQGPVEVQVAPVDFLKDMDVSFAKGDELQIVGSKVTRADGPPLVIARSLEHNKNQLVVRDKQGGPVWTWMKKG